MPVLSGVAETSTAEAIRYVRDCEALGADGFMLMPAMLYKTPDPTETLAHFRTVAKATGLPIMIYNNPISYGNDITPEMFAQLADVKNFVALKESSGEHAADHGPAQYRRRAVTRSSPGWMTSRWRAAMLGIDGWVAGTGIAFPAENQYLWELMQAGRVGKGAWRFTAGSRRCCTSIRT